MPDLSDEIPLKDIPQSFMDSVKSDLKHFLVPFLGLSESGPVPDLIPLGSGTLIRVNDTHGVLTAAHVCHKFSKFEKIHIVLSDRVATGFSISSEYISVKEIWGGKASEWGPDLAFLELALNDVSIIAASKSFLDLSQQKDALLDAPPNIGKGLWAITGLVGEFSDVEHKLEDRIVSAHVDCQAFFSTIHDTHERQGHDYFDVGVSKKLDGVPVSFGGVSGGGLWQIQISKNKDGEIYWNGNRYFRGVAFWESEPSKGRQIIRFHGPRSIFETAWTEWGFPKGS